MSPRKKESATTLTGSRRAKQCAAVILEVFAGIRGAQEAGEATRALLEATSCHKNFFVSSGDDIPPGSPLANLNAFFRAVAEFNK